MVFQYPVQDLDRGRCKNYRDGQRCLEYEREKHVCDFPPPPPPIDFQPGGTFVYKAPQPKDWVAPRDRPIPPEPKTCKECGHVITVSNGLLSDS